MLSKSQIEPTNFHAERLSRDYGSAFLLTLTNPLTILSFAAVLVGIGVGSVGNYEHASLFAVGIFIGSGLWWLTLTSLSSFFRTRFSQKKFQLVNTVSGLIIAGFGLYFLISLLNL